MEEQLADGLWMRHLVGRRIEVGWPLPAEALPPGIAPDERVAAVTWICQPGARPYLHPVRAVNSLQILTQDRPADHPWQHGIFTALHAVNGLDFWTEHRTPAPERGRIEQTAIEGVTLSRSGAGWCSTSVWLTPDERQLLTETHEWTVHAPTDRYYLIDLVWRLRAERETIVVNHHDYGGLAVRLINHSQREHRNSVGLSDAATSEARATWCDVSAPFDGSTRWTAADRLAGCWHGIAVLDHPFNIGYPSAWRVDGQGLINPSPSLQGDWLIDAESDRVFRYQLVVHADPADPALLNRLQTAFAESGG